MLHIGTIHVHVSFGIGVHARTLLQRGLVYLMTCMCLAQMHKTCIPCTCTLIVYGEKYKAIQQK